VYLTQNRERERERERISLVGGTANNLKINACSGPIKKDVYIRVTNSMPTGPRRQYQVREGQSALRSRE